MSHGYVSHNQRVEENLWSTGNHGCTCQCSIPSGKNNGSSLNDPDFDIPMWISLFHLIFSPSNWKLQCLLQDGAPSRARVQLVYKWLNNSMVYGRYNELVFMGKISWLINQHSHHWGGPSWESCSMKKLVLLNPCDITAQTRGTLE